MRVVSVVGARPQFVKAAVVSRHLRQRGVHELLVHTGQHYDDNMSLVFFQELGIPAPDHNLEVGSGPHGAQTARMLEGVERILLESSPDWLLVYGDTNSTIAGALAAVKLHVRVAHVEAGLRSFNRRMPEEWNRVLTDHSSDLLFAPTTLAVHNLQREGIDSARIRLVGDVMYDAALFYAGQALRHSRVLERLNLTPRGYVLATIHRADNTDDPKRCQEIFSALERLSEDIPVVVPLHPRTRARVRPTASTGMKIIDPVGYLDMIALEKNAALIATDSGGVQKEAFFHRVPCVTLREETEWQELVELGWNRLAPPHNAASILTVMRAAREDGAGREAHPYGQGDAASKIVEALCNWSGN